MIKERMNDRMIKEYKFWLFDEWSYRVGQSFRTGKNLADIPEYVEVQARIDAWKIHGTFN